MRTSFSKLSLFALPLAALTACQDYEPFSEAEVAEAAAVREYSKNFENRYGVINPEHNWGFFDMPGCEDSATRGANTEQNQWESKYHLDVPGGTQASEGVWGWSTGDITAYERAYVYWWFSTHKDFKTKIEINWSNYFIENVWGQPHHSGIYSDGSQYTNTQQFGMDAMDVLLPNGTKGNLASDTDYDHINDFNAGGGSKEQVMYMYGVTTDDFGYHASMDSKDYNNWTIQYINGNYYLAFDYEHHKGTNDPDADVECDGYYNDWILKLSNGLHIQDNYSRRVMCEDLGSFLDLDFNDVVFDVNYTTAGGNNMATITLQAAVGTMPLKIAGYEVHELFHVPTTQIVNCDKGVKRPAVTLNIPVTSKNPNDIKIEVPSYSSNDAGIASWTVLKAEKNKAPQKFACPTTTRWVKEMVDIKDAYGDFMDWVGMGSVGGPANSDPNGVSDYWCVNYDASNVYMGSVVVTNSDHYFPNNWNDNDVILPWKQLWDECGQQYDVVEGRPAFEPSFESQAPAVPTADHDYVIVSPRVMGGETLNHTEPFLNAGSVTLTLTAGEGGSVSGAGTYDKGAQVVADAIPYTGYSFVKWNDGNTNPHRNLTLTEDRSLSASFVRNYSEYNSVIASTTDITNGNTLVKSQDVTSGTKLLICYTVSDINYANVSLQGCTPENSQYYGNGQAMLFEVTMGDSDLKIGSQCQNITSITVKKSK